MTVSPMTSTTPIDFRVLRDQAVTLREKGLTVPQIASKLRLPRATIYSWLPSEEDGDSRVAQMLAMRKRGKTNKEIAAHFGITRQRVSAILGPADRRGRPADPRAAIRIRLAPKYVDQVVEVAGSLGVRTNSGAYAGRGSINAMLEEIAKGNLLVSWRDGATGFTHLIEDPD